MIGPLIVGVVLIAGMSPSAVVPGKDARPSVPRMWVHQVGRTDHAGPRVNWVDTWEQFVRTRAVGFDRRA